MNQLHKFTNPNVLQVDEVTGSAQGHAVSITCPHCRKIGSFASAHGASGATFRKKVGNTVTDLTAVVRICPNMACRGLVFVVSQGGFVYEALPRPLLDFDLNGLPARCQTTLEEAVRCHAAGAHRAAAMMVRRLLEEICDENGATGNNLHQRLAALKTKITLPNALFDAMSELKALGNDAAHVEAKDYDSIGKDEAEDSIELAKEILKSLYQLQGLVGRLQARKANTTATTT